MEGPIEALIRKFSVEYDLPIKTVEKLVYSQFKYVAKIMAEGKHEAIRLPYLGQFHVRPGRLKNLEDAKRKAAESRRRNGRSAQ